MNARKQRRSSGHAPPLSTEPNHDDSPLQGELPWYATQAAFAAMLLATPLLPGEAAAEQGVANPLAVGWLAVAALVLAVQTTQLRRAIFWNPPLLCVLGFGVWMVIPTLFKFNAVHPRPAINISLMYLGGAAFIFAGVQLLQEAAVRRRVLALLLVLATSLSAHGFTQYFITMPSTAAQYFDADEQQKQRTLIRFNLDPGPGSSDRRHFEDRLRSTEPFATFGLANSLAGFLAPAFLLAAAAACEEWARRRRPLPLASLAIVLLMVGGCLVLTKSRTAYLATAGGCVLFAAVYFGGRLSWRQWLLGGAAGGLLLIAAGTLASLIGGLDVEVLSESLKSFAYRVEYWRATLAMIGDHPLLGVGPGQFQAVYPHYKLPLASETVADPHNFLLEVAAIAGIPALLLLLAAIGWTAIRILRQRPHRTEARSTGEAAPGTTHEGSPFDDRPGDGRPVVGRSGGDEETEEAAGRFSPVALAVNLGGGFGVVIALAVGTMTYHIPDGWAFLSLLVGFALCWPLTFGQWRLPTAAVPVALATWGVHHLASGGFGFPGVAIVMWIFAAVMLGRAAPVAWRPAVGPRLGLLVLVAVLIAAGMQLGTRPLEARQALESVLIGNSPLDLRRLSLEARRLDPYWVEPLVRLASADHHRWLQAADSKELRETYELTEQQMVDLDPQTWLRRRQAGDWRLVAWRVTNDREQVERAIQRYQQALERYPASLELPAQLAWAYHLAGNDAEAARWAEEALRRNADHPHEEQKLEYFVLFDFDPGPGRFDTQRPPPAHATAEPVMRQLRKPTEP